MLQVTPEYPSKQMQRPFLHRPWSLQSSGQVFSWHLSPMNPSLHWHCPLTQVPLASPPQPPGQSSTFWGQSGGLRLEGSSAPLCTLPQQGGEHCPFMSLTNFSKMSRRFSKFWIPSASGHCGCVVLGGAESVPPNKMIMRDSERRDIIGRLGEKCNHLLISAGKEH